MVDTQKMLRPHLARVTAPRPDARTTTRPTPGAARPRRARAWVCAVAAGLAAAAVAACLQPRRVPARALTGTCAGVCEHYTRCRGISDPRVDAACRDECNDVFSSPDARRAFESLRCDDAVAFVEGASGRPPGVPAAPVSERPR